MKPEQLQHKVEQNSIEKIIISKMPASEDFWFVYSLDRETQQSDLLTTDQGAPLAFLTLDCAIDLLYTSGFDGTVDVLWDKEYVTCN